MNKRIMFLRTIALILSSLLTTHTSLQAQRKYWVKFNDKNGSPFSLNTPSAFLTKKSIDRRAMYNVPYDATDLPVNQSYVNSVASVSGVKVLYASKWLNGVVILIDNPANVSSVFATINAFSFVSDTSRVVKFILEDNTVIFSRACWRPDFFSEK